MGPGAFCATPGKSDRSPSFLLGSTGNTLSPAMPKVLPLQPLPVAPPSSIRNKSPAVAACPAACPHSSRCSTCLSSLDSPTAPGRSRFCQPLILDVTDEGMEIPEQSNKQGHGHTASEGEWALGPGSLGYTQPPGPAFLSPRPYHHVPMTPPDCLCPFICSFLRTSIAPRVCVSRLVLHVDEEASPSLFCRPQCSKTVMR